MRVLVAPQEFKGSLAADEAAQAMVRGLRAARPDWQLDVLPLADGGPGFITAMRLATRGHLHATVTHDALGRKVLGRYLEVPDSATVLIESAQANGLYLVDPVERDPLAADTFGVGEFLLAAAELEPEQIIIGVGGSATTDGGAGMARALGARFLDAVGAELPPGGGPLARLARIEWQPPAGLRDTEVIVAADVTNPLVGPSGAAKVYGPQKGASGEQAEQLDLALRNYAEVLKRDLGVDLADMPGAGAAGGLAGGFVAFLGAHIESGFDVVASATNLEERLAAADVVLTGEGSFDAQSLQGKGPGRLLDLAQRYGKRAVLFAGRATAPAPEIHAITEVEPDSERAMANAGTLLEELVRRWAAAQPDR